MSGGSDGREEADLAEEGIDGGFPGGDIDYVVVAVIAIGWRGDEGGLAATFKTTAEHAQFRRQGFAEIRTGLASCFTSPTKRSKTSSIPFATSAQPLR